MAPTRKAQHWSLAPSSTTTPERSAIKKPVFITQRQKQALIDNLQLEITERARRLRAQYALQAHSLRSKLERRVSRVPPAMRKKTMGELLLKYATTEQAKTNVPRVQVTKKTVVRKDTVSGDRPVNPALPPQQKGTKRKSDEMHGYDKENTPDPSVVPLPKRQARDVVVSRTNVSTVLSPKSNNSRTLPHSPIRPPFISSAKAAARPQSPLRPISSPFKSAAMAATVGLANMVAGKSAKAPAASSRTNSRTTKPTARVTKATQATQVRVASAASNTSTTSGSSTGTIVRRVGAAIKNSVAPKKPATTRAAAAKKATTSKTKAESVKPATVAASGRTLRKRL